MLAHFTHGVHDRDMNGASLRHYALYGETGVSLPPEFIHLERIRDRSILHDWTIDPHVHPHMIQFLLLEGGECRHAEGSASRTLRAPALILVPPSCAHAFRFANGAQGWVLSLAADLVSDPRLAPLLSGLGKLQGQSLAMDLPGSSSFVSRLAWLLRDLDEQLAQGELVGDALLAQVGLILVSALCVSADADQQTVHDPRERLVARLRNLIEAHFRDRWSVASYAAALATTPSTLTRATKALTGRGPADLVHDRIVLEAKRKLAFTGASVAQVAYALGFVDPAYFARFFKTRTGFTASEFRERQAWTERELPDSRES